MAARAGPAGSGGHGPGLWSIEGITIKLFFFSLIDQAGSNGFCFQSFNPNISPPFLRLKFAVSIFNPPGPPERPASAGRGLKLLNGGWWGKPGLEPA